MGLHDILRGDVIPLSGTKVSIGRNRYDPPAPFVPVEEVIQNIAVFVDPATGTSGVIRFKGSLPAFEISLDGGTTFSSPAAIPSNINGQILFTDNNAVSVDSGLTYNKTLDILGVSGELHLKALSNNLPYNHTVVPSGEAKLEAISLANRDFLGITPSSGSLASYPLQAALFARYQFTIFPNTGTTVGVQGDSVTSVGTVSHPAANVGSGAMINFLTGATAGNTGGTGSNATRFFRGGVSGINTGFFFACRMSLPDLTYDGLRAFVGLTTGTMAASVGSNDPAGDRCGFFFSTTDATHGKNWQFATKNNTTQSLQSTNVQCSGVTLYEMFIYSPPFPKNGAIYWTIRDMSNLKEVSGYQFNNLPRVNQPMRPGLQISNVTATARNVRLMHLYTESE